MNKRIIIELEGYGRVLVEGKSIERNKERNTYIVSSENLAFIVDPQNGSRKWLKDKLGVLSKYRRVFVLVSHSHENHYSYLNGLLAYLAGQVESTLIIPESFNTSGEQSASRCIRVNVGEHYALTADARFIKIKEQFLLSPFPIAITGHSGHCSSLLNLNIRNEKDRGVLFCSDNLTTCFVPLITDGGDRNAMIEYLSIVLMYGPTRLLPGHGRDTSKAWIRRLIKYFRGLPFCEPPNSPYIRTRELRELSSAFHHKNILSVLKHSLDG